MARQASAGACSRSRCRGRRGCRRPRCALFLGTRHAARFVDELEAGAARHAPRLHGLRGAFRDAVRATRMRRRRPTRRPRSRRARPTLRGPTHPNMCNSKVARRSRKKGAANVVPTRSSGSPRIRLLSPVALRASALLRGPRRRRDRAAPPPRGVGRRCRARCERAAAPTARARRWRAGPARRRHSGAS